MAESDSRTRPRRVEPPSEELLLAAIERAARHRTADAPGAPIWAILEHLAIAKRTAAARHVRARLEALEADRSLERARRYGVIAWALTERGRQQLARARTASKVGELPESPQHRDWRDAQAIAERELGRFACELGTQLEDVSQLLLALDAEPPPHSDVWLERGEALRHACKRLAAASHCLHEWHEPDDSHSDIDDRAEPADAQLDPREQAARRALRAGRRNVRRWASDAGQRPT